MADTSIAVTTVTINALSSRIDGTTPGAIMTSVTSGNTAVIAAKGNTNRLLILVSGDGTHTATLGVTAGDEPPSETQGLGALSSLSVAATGSYVLPLASGRFVQDDGTIRIPVTGTGPVYIGAIQLNQAQ